MGSEMCIRDSLRIEVYKHFVECEDSSKSDELIGSAINSNKRTGGAKFVEVIRILYVNKIPIVKAKQTGPEPDGTSGPVAVYQPATSKRSCIITLFQAATKSLTSFSWPPFCA